MYPAPLGVRELKMPLLPKKDITDMADRQKNHVRITRKVAMMPLDTIHNRYMRTLIMSSVLVKVTKL